MGGQSEAREQLLQPIQPASLREQGSRTDPREKHDNLNRASGETCNQFLGGGRVVRGNLAQGGSAYRNATLPADQVGDLFGHPAFQDSNPPSLKGAGLAVGGHFV